jgi:hypothetical protein
VGAALGVDEPGLGEAHIEANLRAYLAQSRLEWLWQFASSLHRLAFLERRAFGDIDVEKVQFLVALGDLAFLVDPDQGVFGFLTVCRLVDTYVYGQFVLFCGG